MAGNIIILTCDICKKQNRIRRSNLYKEQINAVLNNNGTYCQKCKSRHTGKGIRYVIFASECFTIYPNVVSIEDLKGAKHAKEIMQRGLEILRENTTSDD